MTTEQTLTRLRREFSRRDSAEREAFLDSICAGDDRLRLLLQTVFGDGGAGEDGKDLLDRTAGLDALLAALTTTSEQSASQDSQSHWSPGTSGGPGPLASGSPLSSLSAQTLGELLTAMEPREFDAGEYLMRQGETGDHLLLLLQGTAWALLRDAPSGRPPVGVFGPGDIVGEMALVTNETRTADVVARTRVRAQRLAADDFDAIAERHPELRVVLTEIVGSRLGQAPFDGLGGKDVHGYRITQCIGRGGMGVVYEAHERATGRVVALKMMNHRLIYNPRAVRRFKREAAILQSLNHPSLAALYDCFSAYKTEFLALEFCAGTTLAAALKEKGRLPEVVVRPLLGQLAIALRYIHGENVVHRDLKPSNVMLCHTAQVKLLDFGIGQFAGEPGARAHTGSAHSVDVIGTPRYMAPEQFSSTHVDKRADFYGLACIAFEALAGTPVVKASDLLGIVLEQASFVLPPPERIGDGISEAMHDVLRSGLQYDREKRTLDLDAIAAWAGPLEISVPPAPQAPSRE